MDNDNIFTNNFDSNKQLRDNNSLSKQPKQSKVNQSKSKLTTNNNSQINNEELPANYNSNLNANNYKLPNKRFSNKDVESNNKNTFDFKEKNYNYSANKYSENNNNQTLLNNDKKKYEEELFYEIVNFVKKGDRIGFINILEQYIKQGFDINKKDVKYYNYTLLHYASYEGNLKIVDILLQNAKFNSLESKESRYKHTALHIAVQQGFFDITKKLIERGITITVYDIFKNNVVHICCIFGHVELLKYILDKSPVYIATEKNKEGKSPKDIASELKNFVIKNNSIMYYDNTMLINSIGNLANVIEYYPVSEILTLLCINEKASTKNNNNNYENQEIRIHIFDVKKNKNQISSKNSNANNTSLNNRTKTKDSLNISYNKNNKGKITSVINNNNYKNNTSNNNNNNILNTNTSNININKISSISNIHYNINNNLNSSNINPSNRISSQTNSSKKFKLDKSPKNKAYKESNMINKIYTFNSNSNNNDIIKNRISNEKRDVTSIKKDNSKLILEKKSSFNTNDITNKGFYKDNINNLSKKGTNVSIDTSKKSINCNINNILNLSNYANSSSELQHPLKVPTSHINLNDKKTKTNSAQINLTNNKSNNANTNSSNKGNENIENDTLTTKKFKIGGTCNNNYNNFNNSNRPIVNNGIINSKLPKNQNAVFSYNNKLETTSKGQITFKSKKEFNTSNNRKNLYKNLIKKEIDLCNISNNNTNNNINKKVYNQSESKFNANNTNIKTSNLKDNNVSNSISGNSNILNNTKTSSSKKVSEYNFSGEKLKLIMSHKLFDTPKKSSNTNLSKSKLETAKVKAANNNKYFNKINNKVKSDNNNFNSTSCSINNYTDKQKFNINENKSKANLNECGIYNEKIITNKASKKNTIHEIKEISDICISNLNKKVAVNSNSKNTKNIVNVDNVEIDVSEFNNNNINKENTVNNKVNNHYSNNKLIKVSFKEECTNPKNIKNNDKRNTNNNIIENKTNFNNSKICDNIKNENNNINKKDKDNDNNLNISSKNIISDSSEGEEEEDNDNFTNDNANIENYSNNIDDNNKNSIKKSSSCSNYNSNQRINNINNISENNYSNDNNNKDESNNNNTSNINNNLDNTKDNNNTNNTNNSNLEEKTGPTSFICHALLGKGSFGEVYLVEKLSNNTLYAMKVLCKAKIMGQNLVKYAMTERNVLSFTNHPFIVKLNFAFQTIERLFLILDYCPGGDLSEHIARERRFSEDKSKFYLCQIILAIEDLHKRDIIFRDLKPDNVVLDSDGNAMLTDFGLSKEGILGNQSATSFCGSVAYLAPEMLKQIGHGKSVDWYLVGVIFYEMLSGIPPYFTDNKDQLFKNIEKAELVVPRNISDLAADLLKKLLNKNPNTRLGAGPDDANEVKKHPYFDNINWEYVYQKKYVPPKSSYKPKPMHIFSKPRQFEDYSDLQLSYHEKSQISHFPNWSFANKIDFSNNSNNNISTNNNSNVKIS